MFQFFSKAKNELNGISTKIKAQILDNLFSSGDINITKPNSLVDSVIIKNNRLYAITPITAEELKEIIEVEANWRASQTKEAASIYLGKRNNLGYEIKELKTQKDF